MEINKENGLIAAAYARYSTDKQTDNSIAYQLDKINSYCSDNDITIARVFIDEAQSGTNMERSGFVEMLEAAKRKEFNAVVIYDTSRGSRDVGDWFNFRKLMDALQIKVISCTQKLGDISNSNDFLYELISVGFGQREVLENRQKSIAGSRVQAKQALHMGGNPQFGYDVIDRKYVINENEAKYVRMIFDMYVSGAKYSQILKALEADGVTNKPGTPFTRHTLHNLLTNDKYIGVYTYQKRFQRRFSKNIKRDKNPDAIVVQDAIPAIIDKSVFEAAQARRQSNHHDNRSAAKGPAPTLLNGVIKCGTCGCSCTTNSSPKLNGNGRYYYYVCLNKIEASRCSTKPISAEKLDRFVVYHLKEALSRLDLTVLSEQLAEEINAGIGNVEKEKKELIAVENKIKNGVNAILSGAAIPELSAEIQLLKERKADLEKIIYSASSSATVSAASIKAMFEKAIANLEAAKDLRALVQLFVQSVECHPDGSATVRAGLSISSPLIFDVGQSSIPAISLHQKNKPAGSNAVYYDLGTWFFPAA